MNRSNEGVHELIGDVPEVEWPPGVVVSAFASHVRDDGFDSWPG